MLLWGCDDPARCGPSQGVVATVHDGDTVTLESGDKVRYLLIDAPEIGCATGGDPLCCFGDEGRAENMALVLGRSVRLEYDEECTDRFARLLAYVWRDDLLVNESLAQSGHVRSCVIPPNERYLDRILRAEAEAASAGAGLWAVCPATPGC